MICFFTMKANAIIPKFLWFCVLFDINKSKHCFPVFVYFSNLKNCNIQKKEAPHKQFNFFRKIAFSTIKNFFCSLAPMACLTVAN